MVQFLLAKNENRQLFGLAKPELTMQ